MKYIKKFESGKYKYDVGDYVIINSDFFVDKNVRVARIEKQHDYENSYDVRLANGNTLWVQDRMLIKKLTHKELKTYLIQLDAEKYNL